jgi:hypothetical protein
MAQTTIPVYLTGKVGSVVYTGNRQGTAVRQLVVPKNPQTPAQTTQRQRFAAAAKAWAALTTAARNTWTAFAATLANNLSPFNSFVKVAVTDEIVGVSMPTTAPVGVTLPTVTLSTLAGTIASGVLSLSLTPTASPAPDYYMYRACGPKSQGINAVPQCDVLLVTAGSSPATATALGAAWVAKYGTPAAGQKVFVQINAVKSGIEGVRQTQSCVFSGS